jgi:fructose-bisphosphate aldolase, class I
VAKQVVFKKSHEEIMHPGKLVRIQKLWKHQRAVIIPFDHGSYSGTVPGIEHPYALTERIARTKADGLLVTPGILKAIAPAVDSLGIVLRIDGGFTRFMEHPGDYHPLYSVRQGLSLGADAVIIFTMLGTPAEPQSMARLGQTAAEADDAGVPLICEILAPSILNNHFGSDVFKRPGRAADPVRETADVVRIAAEAGADIIKTRFVGTVSEFRTIVEHAIGARVIVAGGPPMKSTDENLLRLAHDTVQAGAHGVIFGRNVWQHPRMEKIIAALCAVVHEEETVSAALKLLR